jgi:uncharacterized membrane protein YgaE (UPF0421/DUF939 family)
MAVSRVARRLASSTADRWRGGRAWAAAVWHPSAERDVVVQTLKSAAAAGVAWEAAARLLHGPSPFYAPLAALLTVYSTVFRSVIAAAQRVVGVVLGVLLAYLLAQTLPLTGVTVALVVCLALALSRWRRLGDQSSQVPVTALLLLLLGRSDPSQYALARVGETVLGAGIGIAVNLLVAPPTHVRAAADATQKVADSIADVLADLADSLTSWPPDDRTRWARRARQLPRELASAHDAMTAARESQRLNPRTALRPPRSLADLESSLDTLERVAVHTRTSVRRLADLASDDDAPALDETFLRTYTHLLRQAARAVAQFGQDLRGDPRPHGAAAPPVDTTRDQLQLLTRNLTPVTAQPRELLTYTALLAELDALLAQLNQPPGSDQN